MSESPRVLVSLGGIPLFGQERGNIQVFNALRDVGVEALFVTHEKFGHQAVQPALDALGLRWTTAPYPWRWGKIKSVKQTRRRIREAVATVHAFRQIAREFRPTHLHTMNEQYALVLLPLFWLLRVPIIYRVGDAPRQHHPVYRFIWRRLFAPHVTQFVAISRFIRDELIGAGVPAGKIRVIYNFPPERPALPWGSDLPDDLATPYDGRTVVYMGQISAIKGVDLLVESAIRLCRSHEDLRFFLAGDYSFTNPFADARIADVEAAGLSDRIRFLGHVEDVPGLLELSDVHVAPSVWEEPLSNVVGEAKQAGVPSVVFPSGGLPELALEHGRDAFVCREKTADALTEGLLHYVSMSPDHLARASRAATDSLSRLGITETAFTETWAEVYAAR